MALPDLSGFGAMLIDRRDGGPLRAVALPGGLDALAVDLSLTPVEGGLGDLLLYRGALATLDLPLDGELLARTAAPSAPTLPEPDRAFALTPELTWADEPTPPFAEVHVEPRPCLAPHVTTVELEGDGDSEFFAAWGDEQVLIAASPRPDLPARMFVVSQSGATQVAMPPLTYGWRGAVDDRGAVWFAEATAPTDTEPVSIVAYRLDERLSRVERMHRVRTGETIAADPWNLVVRNSPGGVELALVATKHDDEAPRVFTWHEGDEVATTVPWPRPEDGLPQLSCRAVGVYRTFLSLTAPGTLEFIVGDGFLTRWRGGQIERERIDGDACGGALADGDPRSSWAIIDTTIPPLPSRADPRRIFRKRGAEWIFVGEEDGFVGLSAVTWNDRGWTTGGGGRIYELEQHRDWPARICPPVVVDPDNDRIERLVSRGGALAAAGPHRPGNPWRVYWLTP